MTTTEEKITIMQAYIEGKKLEFKSKNQITWENLPKDPVWNWSQWDYRISPTQPKPKTLFKCYTNGNKLIWINRNEKYFYKDSIYFQNIPSLDKEVELP